jgi:cysteine synthase
MDVSLVDEVIKVNDDQAYGTSRDLASKEGVFAGSSSGAALYAALQVAARIDHGTVVTLFPDRGDRYFSEHLYE